jgi:alpha-beta hydrolase superfamily lysophospholipase
VKGSAILLHGLGRTAGSTRTLAAAARRASYTTFAPGYPGRHRSIAAIVAQLAPKIATFAAECDGPLHIVTHSLGGLVARSLILAHRPARLGSLSRLNCYKMSEFGAHRSRSKSIAICIDVVRCSSSVE